MSGHFFKANRTYSILHSVLIENVGNVFSIFTNGEQTFFHVEGTTGHHEEVEAGLGDSELARFWIHCVPDVDGAA